MPIYEYICQSCSATFDLLRPYSQADSPTICKNCSSSQVKRKLSTFFAHSDSTASGSTSSSSCGSCSGHSCANCHH
ncbi:MAG: zinc ribbon domain-containing protein [Anaerolineaceae bacterium]|nr:zinc ribbon domain-containing protein [Anaerolineaceae bacterium]